MTEITPAMMDAGMKELTGRYMDLCAPMLELYPEIISNVYRAMEAVRLSENSQMLDEALKKMALAECPKLIDSINWKEALRQHWP